MGELDQGVDLGSFSGVVVAMAGAQDADLFVGRRDDSFALGDQLFVELLAGPQPRENGSDVRSPARTRAGGSGPGPCQRS